MLLNSASFVGGNDKGVLKYMVILMVKLLLCTP